jgi:hypothetical protein
MFDDAGDGKSAGTGLRALHGYDGNRSSQNVEVGAHDPQDRKTSWHYRGWS